MKFINLSPPADFNSKFQSQITVLNQNILYITHEVDKIKKIVNEIKNDIKLQKQVDDYFDDQDQITKEGYARHETSPQTELEDK